MFNSFKFFSFIFKSPSLLRWLIVVVGIASATLSFESWPVHALVILLFLLLNNISVLYIVIVVVMMMVIVQCLSSTPLILLFYGWLRKLLFVLLNDRHLKLMTLKLLCVFMLYPLLEELVRESQLLLWHVGVHCVVEWDRAWWPGTGPYAVSGKGSYMLHWLAVSRRTQFRFLAGW